MGTLSTSVLFLGIERCLLLLFPYDFDEIKRKIFAIIEIIFIFGLILLYLFVNILSEIPTIERTKCYAFGCMMTEHHKELYDHKSLYIYVRYVVALLNCIIGSVLFFIFYQKSKQNQVNGHFVRSSRNNKLVLWTITVAFLFDFLPHFAAFCSKTFFNINPNQYIGPYGLIFTTLDVVICAEVSRRIFKSQKAFVATTRVRLNSSFRLPRSINIKKEYV
uniref:Vomeronasal type-1 receptor n=1 Tax=Panagrolaimus davidi TaxID=227884 RepID=A0A914PWV8_9BILA